METQLELSMTDQQSSSSEATLTLSLTGNPWTDFGIVSLCEELRLSDPPFLVEQPFLMENEATITINVSDIEMVETWFNGVLKSRWNQIYWLHRVGKILNRSLTYDAEGFVVTDEKTQITEGEKAQIKELLPQTQVKDEMPIAQSRLNFIGFIGKEGKTGDARKIQQQRETIIHSFVTNWILPEGKRVCEASGRMSNKLEEVHQVVNPFLNKHHNVKVRGFRGTNSYLKVGPILRFVNLCMTLEPHIPFIHNQSAKPDPTTFLVLPEIADLALLAQVYARLQMNLKDISDRREIATSTNLRGIRRASDTYSLAIALFHNIFYLFTVEDENDNEGYWDFAPLDEPEQIRGQVTRWVIIPFAKKQNIRFGNFHIVEVDHRLYDFIRPIPFGDGDEIRLVPDIVSCTEFSSPGGENAIRHLSQAIATSDTRLMKDAIFELWKHTDAINFRPQKGRPHPVRLLRYFIQHFLEVNAVLNEELREDLRAIANTVGQIFNRDVTLISKLYNISSENTFRSVLNQVIFRLYKVSTGDTAEALLPLRQERIRHILDEISPENWKEMAETLSTFVSLSAFNANVFESKPKSNGEIQ